MTRQRSSGRTTPKGARPARPTRDDHDQILPLRKRRPIMFWIIILAVVAMVFSTVAGVVAGVLLA